MDSLLRRLGRSGLRRGLRGEHWAWFALALAAYVLRRARRPDDDAVRLSVRAGERYEVLLSDPGADA